MTDLLRRLLDLRDTLEKLRADLEFSQYLDELPELAEMQKLERAMFKKIDEWEKPD